MNAKKLRASALAAAVCLSGGVFSCGAQSRRDAPIAVPAPKAALSPRPQNQDEIARKLERQLSKYGPWIGSLVDLDNTDGKNTGVQIYMSTARIKDMVDASDSEFRKGMQVSDTPVPAMFDARYNVIFITQDAEDFIDHELAHSLTVSRGQFVTLHSPLRVNLPSFSGISIETLNEVTENRAGMLREHGALAFMNATFDKFVEVLKKSVRWGFVVGRFEAAQTELPKKEKAGTPKERRQAKQFIREMAALEKKVDGYKMTLLEIETLLGRGVERYNGIMGSWLPPQGRCPSEFGDITRKFADAEKRIDRLNSMTAELAEIESLSRKVENAFGLEYISPAEKQVKIIEQQNEKMKLDNTLMLGSRGEAFARMMHTLLYVYVGEDCTSLFKLTGDEIGMFEAMKHESKPMFEKSAAKYRLALRMREGGMDPQDIHARLEYADIFESEGKRYEWKPYDAVIIGAIPKVGRVDKSLMDSWLGTNKAMPVQNLF